MSELRKPCYKMLLHKQGKETPYKIEFFNANLFHHIPCRMYRLRINGKWWPAGKKQFFYKTKIMQLLSKSIQL